MPNPLSDTPSNPLSGALQSDLVWRNQLTGANLVWNLDRTQFAFNSSAPQAGQDFHYLSTVPDANWEIKGTGDFNRDNRQDVVWRDRHSGQNIVWYLNGSNFTQTSGSPRQGIDFDYLPTMPSSEWSLQAIADFNLDGYSDIVWRNTTTGDNAVWYLQRNQFVQNPNAPQLGQDYNYFSRVADQNWQIKGAGDFNNDGFIDLLWRHQVSGDNLVWKLKNHQFVANPNAPQTGQDFDYLAKVADRNWDIVATGHFNGDAKIDIVWRHTPSGTNLAWLLNGTQFAVNNNAPQVNQDFAYLPTVPDSTWEIVGSLTRSQTPDATPTNPPAPNNPPPNNGATLQSAFDLGGINGTIFRQESISSNAANDYYRFTVSGQQSVSVLLSGLSANADLQILDAAGNRIKDAFNRFSENNTGTTPDVRNRLLSAGTYYLRVYGDSINTNYKLSILGLSPNRSDTDRIIDITNFYRTQSGLNALTKNTQLTNAAQDHSQSMALDDFFDHTGLNGSTSTQRAQAAGYGGVAGENIAAGQINAEHVMERWMYSEGHRRNIFDHRYQDIGIGYYYLANDTGTQTWRRYWTSNFGIRT